MRSMEKNQRRSSSSEGEDDEEALKCAAIGRLLRNAQISKILLCSSKASSEEEGKGKDFDDIKQLELSERKALLDKLVKIPEEDNERFLLKLRERIDRVGVDIPTIEVRFENLNVEAQVYVGSRALPTLHNFFVNMLEGFLNYLHIIPSPKKPLHILQNISGIIKPQRMTLLLGPPGSGKTTLLLALAGKLGQDLKYSGRVTYNGHGLEEFVAQRSSAYIGQHDNHIGEMTVRETLAFSARCQGVGHNYEMLSELLKREQEANIEADPDIDAYMKAAALEGQHTKVVTDYILKILGLEVCADIMVGDEMIRGISGGQKKRLTTGEMLVGPVKVFFMDDISTGLDSSTTFQIMNSIRQSIHILNETALVSLLQPAPETYELFDDIILLTDGHIVYQGPRENVLEFFESMGFKCPERKGVADFLQEVTSRKDQWQYWARKEEAYNFVTVNDFVEAFKTFHIGQQLSEELANPYEKSKCHPNALSTKKYGVNKKELLKATFYGMMTMAITPNPHVASILSTSFYSIWCLFSGFIMPFSRIPIWWKWYYWICPVAWTLYGLVVSQYGDMMENLENGVSIEEFVRNYFGFKHDFLGEVASVMVAFSLLFALIFAFGIKAFNFQKR